MKKILKKVYSVVKPVLDLLNKYFSLYSNFGQIIFQNNTDSLNFLGAKIDKTTSISKVEKISSLPINLEINQGCKIKELSILNPQAMCLVEKNLDIKSLIIRNHMIVTKTKTYIGEDLKENFVIFSIDVERSPTGVFDKKLFREFLNIFLQLEIPSTWGIVGELFFELESEIEKMKKYRFIEIGYHSFYHHNYSEIGTLDVFSDIEKAKTIRSVFKLELNSFIFPFNKINHIDILVEKGDFKFFRAYISRNIPKIINFNRNFLYFNTSDFFSPRNIENYIKSSKKIFHNNRIFFTHPWNWQSKDLTNLFDFLKIIKLRKDLVFKKFDDFKYALNKKE